MPFCHIVQRLCPAIARRQRSWKRCMRCTCPSVGRQVSAPERRRESTKVRKSRYFRRALRVRPTKHVGFILAQAPPAERRRAPSSASIPPLSCTSLPRCGKCDTPSTQRYGPSRSWCIACAASRNPPESSRPAVRCFVFGMPTVIPNRPVVSTYLCQRCFAVAQDDASNAVSSA